MRKLLTGFKKLAATCFPLMFSLHAAFMSSGKDRSYGWTSFKYCSTSRKHLLFLKTKPKQETPDPVLSVPPNQQPEMSLNARVFGVRTAPIGSPTGMNAACLLSLPLICTTASACCPMIHSCWIIDALFIDLWRASSVRPGSASTSLLFHPPPLRRTLSAARFFIFATRPPQHLPFFFSFSPSLLSVNSGCVV